MKPIPLIRLFLYLSNNLAPDKNTTTQTIEALSRQPWGNFLCLTTGRKLPKSVSAILFSAEGPASEYWPSV